MDKKRKILLIALGAIIITLCSVATYAYFSATITGNSNNKNVKVDMSKMKLEFSDKTGLVKADNINPGWTYQKKVSVTNTGTVPVTYDLVWLSLANEIEKDEMVYSITCDNCNGVDESPVPTFGGENLKIVTNTIEKDTTQEYTINFTFKEINDLQDYNQNKEFKGNIGIKENNTYEESLIGLLSDTDWEYTIDDTNNKVTLTRYISENKNVEIYPIYLKDNKQYKTVIKDSKYTGNPKFQFIFSNIDYGKYYSIIEKVKFMGNIEFENNSMETLFYGCTNLNEIDISRINFSKISSVNYWVFNCTSIINQDQIIGFNNLSKLTNMNGLFRGLSKIQNLNIKSWDTSKVTDMSNMFSGCSSLTNIDLTGLDTSKVTTMSWMFSGCSSLTNIDLTGLDTSKVTNMSWMFQGCSSLISIDLSSLDTSAVTNINSMFYNCNSLTSVDVTNFDTSNFTELRSVFANCSSLTDLDLSTWKTPKLTDTYGPSGLFENCSALKKLNIKNLDLSNVSDEYSLKTTFKNLPTDIEITTSSQTKDWINEHFPEYTNITVV